MSLHVVGTGHARPDTEITNAFLEELDIGTTGDWILERVGIHSRRSVLPLDYIRTTRNRDLREATRVAECTGVDLAVRAARQALGRAGLDARDIGMVVSGSSVPGTLTPCEAADIARALEIEAPVLDVNSACTSFLAHLRVLSMMRPEALPGYVLITVPEATTLVVDYNDRSSAVLWGDAAGAAIVTTRDNGSAELLGARFGSSPAGAGKVRVPRTGHFHQDGGAVQKFAIRKTAEEFLRLRETYGSVERRLHFIGHQANLRMLEAVCRHCEIPETLHHSNVARYGNTAAAGSLSVLSDRWEEWTSSDDVALVGVGAGLSWGSCLLRFGDSR